MSIKVIDFETTGMGDDAGVVEVACVTLSPDMEILGGKSTLVDPGVPIEFGAMGVHHITEKMVMGKPKLAEAFADVVRYERGDVLVAHNAAFDKRFVPEDVRDNAWWVCTMRCAMHIWPDAPTYSNQGLRYWLGMDVEFPEEAGSASHRALYDAVVTARLLQWIREEVGVSLVKLTKEPVLFKKVMFGKHYGKLWSEVDKSYLEWCLKQDMDEDTMHTVRHWLGVAV